MEKYISKVNLEKTETARQLIKRAYSDSYAERLCTITVHYNDAPLLKGSPSKLLNSNAWQMDETAYMLVIEREVGGFHEDVTIEVK